LFSVIMLSRFSATTACEIHAHKEIVMANDLEKTECEATQVVANSDQGTTLPGCQSGVTPVAFAYTGESFNAPTFPTKSPNFAAKAAAARASIRH
jgi:hypothetical protein